MEGFQINNKNNEMLNIDRKVNILTKNKYDCFNFNGNNNVVQISETVNSIFINGNNNKIFLSCKIPSMIVNGNNNQINVYKKFFLLMNL